MRKIINKFQWIGLLFVSFNTFSQNVEISIGQETSFGKLNYFWSGKVIDDDNQRDITGVDFFISLSAKVKSGFYLRTALGTNDFQDLASIEWDVNNMRKYSFSYVRMNQIVMFILPEYRHKISDKNVLFVNGGFSVTKVLFGTERKFAFSDKRSGIAINSGLNFVLTKNLGVAFSLGFHKHIGVGHNSEYPDISIEKIALRLAVLYSM